MLTLTRRPGEVVDLYAADGTRLGSISVGRIDGQCAKLVFDFPPEIALVRREIPRREARPA